MRANSLTNLGVAINRDIPSGFDLIQAVAEIAGDIETLAPYATEIATIVSNLPDVTTVAQANEIINNLSVTVETLPAGSTATAVLTGTNVHFGIPRGDQGIAGVDGLSPVVELTYDEVSGELRYEVVAWQDMSGNIIETTVEW